jgi:hypothetical protein
MLNRVNKKIEYLGFDRHENAAAGELAAFAVQGKVFERKPHFAESP